ncbi:hypothetical protein FLK61_26175 [Paenalkalicoccus suaedae]|uniref:Uncharacterized protein n=1 Tax=Paenalkalicoccus suaedae TaxID=2592382 RepID=A0A859FBB0_9BACI|nr:hypothetical protein [Paenalkalicoccus suaedae]QKS70250.1 hypothetical protein FLK61_26175 [Paenalkalicoccus suaedae]
MIEAKEKIRHNGQSIAIGQKLNGLSKEEEQRLVALGAAFFVDTKPVVQVEGTKEPQDPPNDLGDKKDGKEDDISVLKNEFIGIELADLKATAKEVGVEFTGNIGHEKLVDRIIEVGLAQNVLSQFED